VAILVERKRKQLASLVQSYPDAHILDVTAPSAPPWVKFSLFSSLSVVMRTAKLES